MQILAISVTYSNVLSDFSSQDNKESLYTILLELLVKYTSPNNITTQNEVLKKVSTYCKKPVTNHTLDKFVDPHVWSFYHSVFFSFTVCSTLGKFGKIFFFEIMKNDPIFVQGYGNITPTHSFGRYFMIVYALIGMPVNAILYTYLGEFFGKTVSV